jgi:hypothetical protein
MSEFESHAARSWLFPRSNSYDLSPSPSPLNLQVRTSTLFQNAPITFLFPLHRVSSVSDSLCWSFCFLLPAIYNLKRITVRERRLPRCWEMDSDKFLLFPFLCDSVVVVSLQDRIGLLLAFGIDCENCWKRNSGLGDFFCELMKVDEGDGGYGGLWWLVVVVVRERRLLGWWRS